SLAPGESAIYTISGTVVAPGDATDTATIVPTTPGCAGQCGGGDISTPTIDATANPVFTQTKTADQTSYILGQAVVYTIRIANTGAAAGTARLVDALPHAVTLVDVSCSVTGAGTCDTAGTNDGVAAGTVNLAPGASAVFIVSGLASATGTVT